MSNWYVATSCQFGLFYITKVFAARTYCSTWKGTSSVISEELNNPRCQGTICSSHWAATHRRLAADNQNYRDGYMLRFLAQLETRSPSVSIASKDLPCSSLPKQTEVASNELGSRLAASDGKMLLDSITPRYVISNLIFVDRFQMIITR